MTLVTRILKGEGEPATPMTVEQIKGCEKGELMIIKEIHTEKYAVAGCVELKESELKESSKRRKRKRLSKGDKSDIRNHRVKINGESILIEHIEDVFGTPLWKRGAVMSAKSIHVYKCTPEARSQLNDLWKAIQLFSAYPRDDPGRKEYCVLTVGQ